MRTYWAHFEGPRRCVALLAFGCGPLLLFNGLAIFCTAEYGTLFDHPVDDGTAALIRVQSPRYRQVRRSTLPRRSSIMDID
jgi:hypothetical protein